PSCDARHISALETAPTMVGVGCKGPALAGTQASAPNLFKEARAQPPLSFPAASLLLLKLTTFVSGDCSHETHCTAMRTWKLSVEKMFEENRRLFMTKHIQARTRIAKQVCLLAIAILAFAGICFSQSTSDWPQFHNTDMQRSNPYETVLGVNDVGSLQVKWSYPVGTTNSSPIEANGVVYIGAN